MFLKNAIFLISIELHALDKHYIGEVLLTAKLFIINIILHM